MHLRQSAIAHCTFTTVLQQLHRPVHAAARTVQAHTRRPCTSQLVLPLHVQVSMEAPPAAAQTV